VRAVGGDEIMMRRNSARRGQWPASPLLLGSVLVLLGGCTNTPLTRSVNPDEPERDRYGVATVFQRVTVGNAEPMPVGGVGLVVGLEGTGGEPPNDENRAELERALLQRGERNVKKLLNSPDVALVLVSAVIRPGTRKGDPIDLEVRIPRGSPATSLRGGELLTCALRNYANTHDLVPTYNGHVNQVVGHPVVEAKGQILVGLGEGEDSARAKVGRIWGGGKSKVDMPYYLVLNSDQQFASMAKLLSDRINQTYLGPSRISPGQAVAVPKIEPGSVTIALNTPSQYRQNLGRFLRVTGLIPLRDPGPSGGETAPPEPGQAQQPQPYRQRLLEDLRDPARCVVAALRLEALGTDSVPHVKKALEEARNPLVRFCCAEALTYLGSTAGAEELADSVRKQPSLRAFALAALASLDEAICQEKLQELVRQGSDDEARYGAFHALCTLNERNPLVHGEFLGDSFWLHSVNGNNRPMVHLTTQRRAEIVLFDAPQLRPPFSFATGDFVVSAAALDDRCIISLIQTGADMPVRKPASLALADIIRTMANMGGTYPDVVDLLQQAHKDKTLSGALRVDALPQGISVEELARLGRQGSLNEDSTLQARPDPRATPTLFEATPRTLREQADRQK
jgi:hypothetical protein